MSVVNLWCGAVTSSSVWVRGKVDGDSVRLAVDTDDQFGNPVWFGPVEPTEDDIASIVASGLDPSTHYHYALEVDDILDTASVGQFHTFSLPGTPFSFRFWFASCAGQVSGNDVSNHETFDAIREHNPLFGVHLGDMHYRDIATNNPALYRDAYDDVLAQSRQQNLYLHAPIAYIWDDHDFGPNDSDKNSPGRPAARTVYRERVPHYPLLASDPPDAGIWQAFTCGRVRFILTDIRSERDPKGDTDGPEKLVLGSEQEDWLMDELEDAADDPGIALICWANVYPWIADASSGADHWGGYTFERNSIADLIETAGVGDMMFIISGDMHALAADDGRNNQWGGFPVLHAASMHASGSTKGGPYQVSPLQTSNPTNQFGICSITDPGPGHSIRVRFSGRRWSS